jgi:glycosyltransferase involved in cell wall biosynthesis
MVTMAGRRSPISVLHVVQPLTEGVPGWVGILVRDQMQRGLNPAVACPQASDVVRIANKVGAVHVPWEAGRGIGLSVVRETRTLTDIVRSLQPDILHLHSAKAGLVGRLAVRGRRATIFQPQGWSFEAVGGLMRRGALAWERLGARWATVIVCVSEFERERGRHSGIAANWRVISNGVDLEQFTAAGENERRDARHRLGLDETPLVVCVGRLCRQKGQDVLLDAWPTVLGRTRGARLALIGDGPDRSALESRRVRGVVFEGFRRDLEDWLAAADVVVLPSRWEGMALTMLAAMARERCVVATDVSGAREALGSDAGAVVPVEDPRVLAGALAERLLDPTLAAAEGTAARARVAERYDARRAVATIAELYAELLAGDAT